jgi:hypothetical protein
MNSGRYSEALREYLWAFDHGIEASKSFEATRGSELLDSMIALGRKYQPAQDVLRQRLHMLASEIVRASQGGPDVDEGRLKLFVRLGTKLPEGDTVMATYAVVKAHLPVQAKLRRDLWSPIEAYLVDQRRYAETVGEQNVALENMRYYIGVFARARPEDELKQPVLRTAIEYTIEHEGGTHFEALLGAGERAAAEAFADELIDFRATSNTFVVLIRHARRAGAPDEAARIKERAEQIVSPTERKFLDEAMTQSLVE